MEIVFVCNSIYTLFIAYVLSTTTYKNHKKILLLQNDIKIINDMYYHILKEGVWEEVYLVDVNEKSEEEILMQIKNIEYSKIQVLHIFHPAWILSRVIMDVVGGGVKVILTEEGTSLYHLKENLNYYKQHANLELHS